MLSPALRRAVSGSTASIQSRSVGGTSIKDDDTYVAEAYQSIAALYAAVFAIAHAVAQVPFDVYRVRKSGKLEVISDHDMTRLLDPELGNANPFFSAYDIHEETQSFLELAGNAFWHLAGGRAKQGGVPTQIYSIPPHRMKVVPMEGKPGEVNRPISHYEYDLGQGKSQRLDILEIVHFRYFNPLSQIIGQSSGQPVREEILIEVFAKSMNKLFFKNGATLSGVLEVEDPIDKPEARALLDNFTDNHAGFWNAFKVRVLSGGAKYNAIQPVHKDMLFYEGMKWTREQVMMAAGVPPILLCIPDTSTYNNGREQKKQFWGGTIVPKLRKKSGAINKQLTYRWGPGLIAKPNLSAIEDLQDSLSDLIDPLQKLFQMAALSPNEIREWVATRQMPDLKRLPDGDQYYLPIGMLPADDEREEPVVTPPGTPPAEGEDPPASDKKAVEGFIKECGADGRRLEDERRQARTRAKAKAMEQRIRALSPVYARAMKTVFKAQEAVLLDNVELLARSADDWLKRGTLPDAENRGLDEIDDLLKALRAGTSKRIEKALSHLVKEFGSSALTDLGLEATDIGFNMVSERVLGYLANGSLSKLTLIDETTADTVKDHIQKAMVQAQLEGLNLVDQAGAIMKAGIESGMDIRRSQANQIAQTETTATFNFSDHEAWLQSGVVETRFWRTQKDGVVRPTHAAIEGQEVNLTVPFNVNGESLMYPGDPAGSAGEVIGCRCFQEPGEFKKGFTPKWERDHLREICATWGLTPS